MAHWLRPGSGPTRDFALTSAAIRRGRRAVIASAMGVDISRVHAYTVINVSVDK